jgi:hypothetical protein
MRVVPKWAFLRMLARAGIIDFLTMHPEAPGTARVPRAGAQGSESGLLGGLSVQFASPRPITV